MIEISKIHEYEPKIKVGDVCYDVNIFEGPLFVITNIDKGKSDNTSSYIGMHQDGTFTKGKLNSLKILKKRENIIDNDIDAHIPELVKTLEELNKLTIDIYGL